MIKTVLFGVGVRGRQWHDALEKNRLSSLVGVVELKTDIPGLDVPVVGSTDEALALEPDAVIIATPPDSHIGLIEPLLLAGVPVLCEKPLSETLAEAASVAHLAEKTGTPLLVGMNFRYVPANITKRRMVQQREMGEPIFGDFRYIRNRDGTRGDLNDYPLLMNDPMLVEQSIHHLDLMRYVYDREVVEVSATMWNPPSSSYKHNSCVSTILRFEGNVVVSYLGTWTSGHSGFDFRWRTDFEKGVIIHPDQFGDLLTARLDPELGRSNPLFDQGGEEFQPMGVGPSAPFEDDTAALLQYFLDVVDETVVPGPTGKDHLLTLNLLDAIGEASQSGRTVNVAEHAKLNGIL